jgi:gliding motility-associated-like protein
MKKIIFLFLSFLTCTSLQSQNADCINAQPLCNNPSFVFNATPNNGAVNDLPGTNSVSNPASNPFSTNSGCLLSGENNPQWLIITIGNAGSLEFVFGAQNSSNPQAGYYDWAMWPYNATACNGIINNTLPPIRCNWNGSSTGGTGIASAGNIPPGGSQSNFEPPLAVQACQQFVICISNFSNINSNVSFLSLGTASLSCNPSCNPNYLICSGASATITPVNFNALTNPTYSIQPGGLTSTTPSFVVSPTITTTYTVFITGLNTNSAVVTNTSISNVTVNPIPVVTNSVTQATCSSPSISASFLLGTNPVSASQYSFTWNPATAPAGAPANPVSGSGFTCTPNPGTTSYTVATIPGGCTTTGSFVVNPIPQPVTFSIQNTSLSNSITCNNPSVTLQAVSNYTAGSLSYSWTSSTFTSGASNITLTPAQVSPSLVITCVAVDPVTTCSALNVFTVGTNTTTPSFIVAPVTQTIDCATTSIATFTSTALNPTVNVSHLWYNSGSTVPFATVAGSVSIQSLGLGTYTVCLLNNTNGCTSCSVVSVNTGTSYATFSITSSSNFSLGCAPTKNTTTINITNAQTFPTPGGVLSFTFWPPSVSSGTTFNTNTSLVTSIPGLWTAVAKDPASQCLTTKQFAIIQNTVGPHSQISVNSNTLSTLSLNCYTPSVVALGSSTVPNTSISWSTPSGTNIPQSTITIAVTTNTSSSVVGTYSLVVKDNNNDCITIQPFLVSQSIGLPTPSITALSTPSFISCYNSPVTLLNSSIGSTGPVANAISWAGPSPQVPAGSISTYSALVPGVYTLTVRDNGNGCIKTGTYNVTENKIPPILNSPPPFVLDCGQQSVKINAIISNTSTAYSYSWTALTPTNVNGITPVTAIGNQFTNVDRSGLYRVTVFNPVNGCRASATVTVVDGALTASFVPSSINGFAPLSVNFNNTSASSGSNGTASITSNWSYGNGSPVLTTTLNNAATIYNNPGTYTVMLIAQKGSCKDSSEQIIVVDIPSKVEVPNVFTPNGDGSNDTFFLRTTNLTEIDAVIFDRWGNKVFEMRSDKGNIVWDGKNQYGKECSSGTYFYVIKTTGKDGKETEQKGTVNIYR